MYIEVAEKTVVYKNISILQTFNCILSLNCREKNKYLSLSQLRVTRQKHLKKKKYENIGYFLRESTFEQLPFVTQ